MNAKWYQRTELLLTIDNQKAVTSICNRHISELSTKH